MIKTLQNTLKQDREGFVLPKSVQDSIPICRLWPDGILMRKGHSFKDTICPDSQKFNSTTEIMEAMKKMLRDVSQQVMENEPGAELRCEKSQRMSETAVGSKARNYRNGY